MHPPFAFDSQTTIYNTFPNCWRHTSGLMILFVGCSIESCAAEDKGLIHYDGKHK